MLYFIRASEFRCVANSLQCNSLRNLTNARFAGDKKILNVRRRITTCKCFIAIPLLTEKRGEKKSDKKTSKKLRVRDFCRIQTVRNVRTCAVEGRITVGVGESDFKESTKVDEGNMKGI